MCPIRFDDLGLPEPTLRRIEHIGFDTPTPIQEAAVPLVLEGSDLIAQAETGTGKTLAFCAPIVGKLDASRVAVQALVLCPTRELAQQVEEVARDLGEAFGLRTALLVGGVHQSTQILALSQGAQFAVGTPGRVLDFLQGGQLRLGWAHFVVLDEADRMLDMGFIDDVRNIIQRTPADRQMLLFSATIPPRLQKLTREFMHEPKKVSTVQGLATVPKIRQRFVNLHPGDKEGFLLDLLDDYPEDTCIVFCNTRKEVQELDRTLWGLGYPAGSLHGDHEQERRFKVLEAFKEKEIKVLVATDVAARGLDIERVTRIVNYDVPYEPETYVHRIGRTARAGVEGESITLVSPEDRGEWNRILRTSDFEVEEIDFTPTRPRKQTKPQRRYRDDRPPRRAPARSEASADRDSRRRSRSGSSRRPSSEESSRDRGRDRDRDRDKDRESKQRSGSGPARSRSRSGSRPEGKISEKGAPEKGPGRKRRRRRSRANRGGGQGGTD